MYLFKLFAMLSNYTAVTRLAQQKRKSYYVQVTCINYSPIQYSVKFTPSPLITATPLTPVLREHIDKSSYRRMPGECRGTMLMMLISLMDTLAWWMWITKANVFSFFPILSLEMRHWSCLLGEERRLFAREIQDGRPGLTLVLQRLTMGIVRYLWYGIFESVVTGFVVMDMFLVSFDLSLSVGKTSVSLLLRRSWKKFSSVIDGHAFFPMLPSWCRK